MDLPIFTQELYDSYCVLLSDSYCALLSDSYCVLLSDSYWVLDLNKLIASAHEQIKPFKCNICDASFTKMGQIPIWRIAVFWRKVAIQITNDVCTVDTGYILFQTQKCSYWGKCNPNLDNCSYCEGRKPYYILTNFLLLLTCYYFNLVELRNLLHPFPNTKMSILGKMQSQSG